jgi:ATP-binding cassette subfamily C protein
MTPTQDIINFQYALFNANGACERINEIFKLQQERVVSNGKDPFISSGVEIELKNLNFGYSSENLILKDINLIIKKTKKVAIVGPSGSGKSTIANLIAGFYEPNSGDIKYNSISFKDIDPSKIRKNIYLILQHPKLFNDTMRFNLTLGKYFSDTQIKEALKIAQIDDLVESLDNKLESIIGKDGVKLSGGQRQRVAIARMLLANPKCVIFDESTSALDVHTEINLFRDLKEFLKDKTVITIAHRLSTIESAEYVFVLEDGKLVDSGTPQELFKKDSGYFARMI